MIFSLITSEPEKANAAEDAGIQRIMIDLERNGKAQRQKGKGLFLSNHNLKDISPIKSTLRHAALVVRTNPINDHSAQEVEAVIQEGADYVMLPYFHSMHEVKTFHEIVKGRVKTILLLETVGAVNTLESIIENTPPDEFHLGLNDLSICLNQRSIFDLFLNGTVESIAARLKSCKIPFGIGGVGAISHRGLPISPVLFLLEQIRLGATRAWLSRSFREHMDLHQLAREFKELAAFSAQWESADELKLKSCHESFLSEIARYNSKIP